MLEKQHPRRHGTDGGGQQSGRTVDLTIPGDLACVNDLALLLFQHVARARSRWIEANVPPHRQDAVWRRFCELRRAMS